MKKHFSFFIITLLIVPSLISLEGSMLRAKSGQIGEDVPVQALDPGLGQPEESLLGQNIREVFLAQESLASSETSERQYATPHELAPPHPDASAEIWEKFRNSKPYQGRNQGNVFPSEPAGKIFSTEPVINSGLTSNSATVAPVVQSPKILVLLLEFQDRSGSQPVSYFQNLLEDKSVSSPIGHELQPVGTLAHYLWHTTYGLLKIQVDVAPNIPYIIGTSSSGWLKSSKTEVWYGTDSQTGVDNFNGPIWLMIQEAVQMADMYVDFSQYDTDNDGRVDHLMIVHAGSDEAQTWNFPDIWTHYGNLPNSITVDGVKITNYICMAETDSMGVFAHEFMHSLGLPDTMDPGIPSGPGPLPGPPTAPSCYGAGYYDLMALGAWNGPNIGDRPARLMVWCLEWLGILTITPTIYSTGGSGAQPPTMLPAINPNPLSPTPSANYVGCIKLMADKTMATTHEYWLIVNRDCTNDPYDKYIPNNPGGGLLIWHIDNSVGSVAANNIQKNPGLKRIDLEEADQLNDLDFYTPMSGLGNPGDAGDWWVTSVTGMDDLTLKPASFHTNAGAQTGYSITNIQRTGTGGMSFTLGLPLPPADTRLGKSFQSAVPILPWGTYHGKLDNDTDKYYFKISGGSWRPGLEIYFNVTDDSTGTDLGMTYYDQNQFVFNPGPGLWVTTLYMEVSSGMAGIYGNFTLVLTNEPGQHLGNPITMDMGQPYGNSSTLYFFGSHSDQGDLLYLKIGPEHVGATLNATVGAMGALDMYLFNAANTALFSGAIASNSTVSLPFTNYGNILYNLTVGPSDSSTFYLVIHRSLPTFVNLLCTVGIDFLQGDTAKNAMAISPQQTKSASLDCTNDKLYFKLPVSSPSTYHFSLSPGTGMRATAEENFELLLCDDDLNVLYYSTGQGIDESFAYQCSIGDYYLVVISTEGQGTFELAVSTNQAPSVSITAPLAEDVLGGAIQVNWSGSDPEDDFLTFDIEISPDETTWESLVLGTVGDSFTLNTTLYTDGNWWLRVTVTDGGDSTSSEVEIKIDNTAPTITLTSPAAGTNVTVGTIVSIAVADDNLDVVYYSWNSGTNSTELTSTPDIQGPITLDVYAVDKAGNWAHEQFSWTGVESGFSFKDIINEPWFWPVVGGALGLIVIVIIVVVIVRRRKHAVP